MASYRIDRINEDIRKELSQLIRNLKDPRVQGMISVTRTETANDLRYCTVYVSPLDKGDVKEVIKGLKSASGFLRRELGHNMSLRYTPELTFVADDSIERGSRIIQMINHISAQDAEKAAQAEGAGTAPEEGAPDHD
ncbi:MAG: 30S ribosome-binding factor RbfA [Clostridiales bacterium]|nr:30S ribosome-binding factor RbfA [Clostridiales bacterium]